MARSLTTEEIEIIRAVADGADIYGYRDALALRRVSREVRGVVRIMRPRAAPKDGAAQQPYFGVKATAAGKRLVA